MADQRYKVIQRRILKPGDPGFLTADTINHRLKERGAFMNYPVRPSLLTHMAKSYLHDDSNLPKDLIDCSLGINPFGCSPLITKELFASTYDSIYSYPPHPYTELRKDIAEYFSQVADLSLEQIVPHTGSLGFLLHINRLFVSDGIGILTRIPSFTSALTDMAAIGGNIDMMPLAEEDNFYFITDMFLEAMRPKHRIVYLDNPNNPTGHIIPLSDIELIAKQCLNQNAILIVDEAYGEFMPFENSAVSLINKYDNVIVVKTFSKGFGLAGLRAGYGIIPKPLIKYMHKLPVEMALTNTANTLAPYVLKDRSHIVKSRQKIRANKEALCSHLKELKMADTSMEVPICMIYTDLEIDLCGLFLKHGLLCERGEDFDGIGMRHLRLRVPAETEEFLKRIDAVEEEMVEIRKEFEKRM